MKIRMQVTSAHNCEFQLHEKSNNYSVQTSSLIQNMLTRFTDSIIQHAGN